MKQIKDLFDPSKDINRKIESVVTFGANTKDDLEQELNEYVVTDKLKDNYTNVMERIREAFDQGSKEVGVWVSGFYGSGKSSFAKYLGYSFDKSINLTDGQTFGAKLMNKIGSSEAKALNNVLQTFNPVVIMIDLLVEMRAGKRVPISDIMYYETLKELGFKTTEPKLIALELLLQQNGLYDDFLKRVKEDNGMEWAEIAENPIAGLGTASTLAHELLPNIFRTEDTLLNMDVDSVMNEKERFDNLLQLVKEKKGNDKVIFVLDEIGLYMNDNKDLITSLEGTMHILKDDFKGKVWVIGTAQQTLTATSPDSANEIFTLNARFPIHVDIEADDIKEIVTRRLLGKSVEGKAYLSKLFTEYGPQLNVATQFHDMQDRSVYYEQPDCESFVNLYPFLPVHIEILLNLLKKLASRSGGVGLRSVIRLIRDILVDKNMADKTIGTLVTPADFYEIFTNDMETNGYSEIVQAAKKAITMYNGNPLAIRICETIAVMQLLDDFKLTLDNIVALLYDKLGSDVKPAEVQELLCEMKDNEGITLQEVKGVYRFMTNAILNVQSERSRIQAKPEEKRQVLVEAVNDILSPLPSVQVYGSLTVQPSVELTEGRKVWTVEARPSSDITLNCRFIDAATFEDTKKKVLSESNLEENKYKLYLICNLKKDKDSLLNDIVKDQNIIRQHRSDTDREIQAYISSQKEDMENKTKELTRLLSQSLDDSEAVWLGKSLTVDHDTYKSEALTEFSKKVYDKYPLANRSMKTNAVLEIATYQDFSTLPQALNPFGIVQTVENGSIDASNGAIVELRDFIEMRNNVSGGEILNRFDKAPYKWSKDTTRYLVALMLKGSLIIVHAGGSKFNMFTEKAAEAMKSNPAFSKLNIEMNDETPLDIKKLITASQNIMTLFNPSKKPNLLPDSIAHAAYECIRKKDGILNKARQLKDTFDEYHIAGADRIATAINYAQEIMETEGAKAPQLLSENNCCIDSFKYVKKVVDGDDSKGFINDIKSLKKLFERVSYMASLPLLNTFKNRCAKMKAQYIHLLDNLECYELYAEYSDLKGEFDSAISSTCIDFYTEATNELQSMKNQVRSSADFMALKDEQKEKISQMLDRIVLDEGKNLDELIQEANNYTAFKMSDFPEIQKAIEKFTDDNATEVHDEPEPPGNKHAHKVTVRNHITDKDELNKVIRDLETVRDNWNEYSGVDFDIQNS